MIEATPLEVETYQTQDGRSPFPQWLRDLKDRTAGARVRVRLARLRLGNFGDTNALVQPGRNSPSICNSTSRAV